MNFIFRSTGTALLETIVSYRPLPSLSQENRETDPPIVSKHINNSFGVYFSLDSEL